MSSRPATCAFFLVLTSALTAASDWPQFRGPNRDNISTETGLLRSWPDGGPEVLWSVPVAEGYAGAAIKGDRLYINDYDVAKKAHWVRCLSMTDGKDLWGWSYPVTIRPNHGITRTVPAVGETLVFSLDPKAQLHALDAATGTLVWQKNLIAEYKATIPGWYVGQNPLLDGDRLLIATGGDALVVALDQATGTEIWRTPNPHGDPMSHASVMPATIGGIKQYVYLTMNAVVGVDAAGGNHDWRNRSSQPVCGDCGSCGSIGPPVTAARRARRAGTASWPCRGRSAVRPTAPAAPRRRRPRGAARWPAPCTPSCWPRGASARPTGRRG